MLAMSVVLTLLATAYLVKGYAYLLVLDGPHDLRRRWVDQKYFMNGQNPYDIIFKIRAIEAGQSPPVVARNTEYLSEVGKPVGFTGGYPPWAFTFGMPFVSLPWPDERKALAPARIQFALFDTIALLGLAYWSFRHGRRLLLPFAGWFVAVAFLGMGSISRVLSIGQYGLVVVGLLLGGALLTEKKRPMLGGILFGIALLKPNIAIPFMLVPLVRGQWKAVVSAALTVAFGAITAQVVTGAPTLEVLRQMVDISQIFIYSIPGPLKWLVDAGIPPKVALDGLAGSVFLCGAVACFAFRRRSPLVLYAVAAVTGRLWTYHYAYDDVMLIFLIVPLLAMVMKKEYPGGRAIDFLVAALVGISLWAPTSAADRTVFVAFQSLCWAAGAILLLVRSKNLENAMLPGTGEVPPSATPLAV